MRYQRIHSQIWADEKFRALSESAKFLFLYILTSPHGNSIGVYVLPKQYIACDLEWSDKQLSIPFDELLAAGLILYDDPSRLICIKNQLKHNPLENPKQVKAAERIVAALPKSHLFSNIQELLNKEFHKPLLILFQERYQIPYGIPEPPKEKEKTKAKTKEPALPDWVDSVLWEEFKKYRKEIKAPVTVHGERLLLGDLKKLVDEGNEQSGVINQTIKSGKWKGFYPIKNGNNYGNQEPDGPRGKMLVAPDGD